MSGVQMVSDPGMQQVMVIGNCPSCQMGIMEKNYTIPGCILACLFFPIGILCCLALQERRCQRCGFRGA